jgi:hypothetical protein
MCVVKDDESVAVHREPALDKSGDTSGTRVRCPRCDWSLRQGGQMVLNLREAAAYVRHRSKFARRARTSDLKLSASWTRWSRHSERYVQ